MSEMQRKFLSADVIHDNALGDRQIRVIANSGKSDRVEDVLVAKGCVLDNYRNNPIVLADHDPTKPIGNFAPEVKDRVEGILTFAPAGISAKADEYCGLYKAGVLRTVSVGFQPIEAEPLKGGGVRYAKWELMELSCVAVPCDPGAVTIARALPATAIKDPIWKVGASRNLPFFGPHIQITMYNPVEAEKAIIEYAGADTSFARKGFLAYDAANQRYILPFATVWEGRLTAIPSVLRASSKKLDSMGLPPDIVEKARAVVAHYEAKMTGLVAPQIKDLYDVCCLAELLQRIGYLHSSAEWEAECEQDESKVPAMLAALMQQAASALIAMTAEETQELLAGRGIEMDDDMVELAGVAPKTKAWRAARAKAGRVLSQANTDHLDNLTKSLAKMADCYTKAADLHDDLHATLEEWAGHGTSAGEHAKAIGESNKPKPADGGADEGGADENDADTELAFAAARRKRELEILELSAL